MGKMRSALTVAVILVVACHANGEEAANGKDSYLAALHNSHQINQQNKAHGLVRIPREDYASVPSSSYDYSLSPSSGYGAPANSYGAPPKAAYGPPKPVYGPPQPVYGPPPAQPMSNGTPHMSPESWLLNKLKMKFNWFTLAKILLKIVIFKKIVKFLALLCLLFFIPTLKPSESESEHSDDESRRRSYDLQYDYDTRLNHVTTFALKAMEAFTIDNELYCPEENFLGCRAKRMFDVIDEEYPLKEILRMYVPHSSRKVFRLHSYDEDGDDHVTSNGMVDDGSNSSTSDSNESRERED
ncbi:AAEL004703-PA [Aedes aegypti]|uniref:AAEL004703-PA n=1 Tax=Aedes aegypti TaxID=7159 RepID=Q0IFK1_AEDAE|nr:AAEL004703-PA [Aedes aegypti]